MTPATRANAEAIAAFVNEKRFTNARISSIASLYGCPIRPGEEAQAFADAAESEAIGYPEDRDYHLRRAASLVGSESHCRQVTAALNAAAKLGLVEKNRAGRGPWRYSAVEVAS